MLLHIRSKHSTHILCRLIQSQPTRCDCPAISRPSHPGLRNNGTDGNPINSIRCPSKQPRVSVYIEHSKCCTVLSQQSNHTSACSSVISPAGLHPPHQRDSHIFFTSFFVAVPCVSNSFSHIHLLTSFPLSSFPVNPVLSHTPYLSATSLPCPVHARRATQLATILTHAYISINTHASLTLVASRPCPFL